MFFDEQQLITWKKDFFKKNLFSIEKTINNDIYNGIKSVVFENKDERSIVDEMFKILDCNKHNFFLASLIYVVTRKLNYKWDGFFEILLENNKFNKEISFDDKKENYPKYIRQCRPDKNFYDYSSVVNIGFYNKNKDFIYKCYDDKEASSYIRKEFGKSLQDIYESIEISQAKSDFFLVASLFREGGISADVCSVAQTSIKPLVQDCNLSFVYDNHGINKNFLFSQKENFYYKNYLTSLINKQIEMKKNNSFNYDLFSSRYSFNTFFLDFFSYNIEIFKKEKINFIENNLFSAFVAPGMEEEDLSNPEYFKKISFKSVPKEIDNIHSILDLDQVCVGKDFFSDQSDNVQLIGENLHIHITNQPKVSYTLPTLDVLKISNAYLSGHACLWINDKYVDFESYLSSVAEQEHHAGFWKKPTSEKDIRIVEDDAIIGFSAGYGCYGHYIVDDMPRIALIKKYLKDDFYNKKVILPEKTPRWGIDLLKFFLGIEEKSFIFFNHETEILKFENLYAASYPHKNYRFHPFIKEFYDDISSRFFVTKPYKRICLSRKAWEIEKTNQRIFLEQDLFEEMARARGFDIVKPEELKIEDQIQLMAHTSCQIGEHGSAQHASVYNSLGMTVGTINPLTEVQVNLGRIYKDKNFICYADNQYNDEKGNFHYSLKKEKIINFLDEIERYEEKKINLVASKERFFQ